MTKLKISLGNVQSKMRGREDAQDAATAFATHLVNALGDSDLQDLGQAFAEQRTDDFSAMFDQVKAKLLDAMR